MTARRRQLLLVALTLFAAPGCAASPRAPLEPVASVPLAGALAWRLERWTPIEHRPGSSQLVFVAEPPADLALDATWDNDVDIDVRVLRFEGSSANFDGQQAHGLELPIRAALEQDGLLRLRLGTACADTHLGGAHEELAMLEELDVRIDVVFRRETGEQRRYQGFVRAEFVPPSR